MYQQQTGTLTLALAMSLALVAAIASTPRQGPHVDDALLQLLKWQGSATEFAPAAIDEIDLFVGP